MVSAAVAIVASVAIVTAAAIVVAVVALVVVVVFGILSGQFVAVNFEIDFYKHRVIFKMSTETWVFI